MMFILDTNVVSELRKVRLGKADERATKPDRSKARDTPEQRELHANEFAPNNIPATSCFVITDLANCGF